MKTKSNYAPEVRERGEAVEFATLAWVDRFNNRRLLEPLGFITLAEAEANHYASLDIIQMAA